MVATADAPWVVRDGREEKLLELADGRYTALVRLGAGGELVSKDHTDLFVLDGDLRGATAYPAGTYVRVHGVTRWSSARGATLVMKQRTDCEAARLAIDTAQYAFQPTGVSIARMREAPGDRVALLHFAPGSTIASHVHELGEEFFVLRGELSDEYGTYSLHTWVRQPVGSQHSVRSPSGALLFVFANHLRDMSSS